MKTKLTLFLLLITTASFAQTIRRVNNNGVTGTNIYSTIQAAHDAAVDGDIIYVEGTKTSYAGLTCTKQLTFVGAGYFLVDNAPMQADLVASVIQGVVQFNLGSSGSSMYGMYIPYNGNFSGANSIQVNASNITITRNYIGGPIYLASNISNLLFSQNYFWRMENLNSTGISNLNISNNLIIDLVSLSNSASGIFSNNTLAHRNYEISLYNFTISNNIYVSSGTGVVKVNNNTFSNNIGSGTQFPLGNGNQQNVNMANVFVVDPSSTTVELDNRWKLKTGSPAIGAGVGGVDCGAFGGANPYVLSGIPPYPTITSLITSGVGNSTTPINVVISTKSN